jgi:hypothetical protein
MSSRSFFGTQPVDNESTYDLDELLSFDERSQHRASVASDQGLADTFHPEVQDDNYSPGREERDEAVQLGVSRETYDSDREESSVVGHESELAVSEPEETYDSDVEEQGGSAIFKHESGHAFSEPAFSEPIPYHLANPLPTFTMDELDLYPSAIHAESDDSTSDYHHQADHSTIANNQPSPSSSTMDNQHVVSPLNNASESQIFASPTRTNQHQAHRSTDAGDSRTPVQRAIARFIGHRKAISREDPEDRKARLARAMAAADARQILRATSHRQFVKNPRSIEGFAIASIHRSVLGLDRSAAARATEQYQQRFARHNPISIILRSLGRPGSSMTIRRPNATILSPRNEVSSQAQAIINSSTYCPPSKSPKAIEATKDDQRKMANTDNPGVEEIEKRVGKSEKKDEKAKELFRKVTAKFGRKKQESFDDNTQAALPPRPQAPTPLSSRR